MEQQAIAAAFLPTGDRLISGSYDRTVRTWDVQSGQSGRTIEGYALRVYALSWSPDGRFLVSGSSESTLTLWNVAARAPVRMLRGHTHPVFAVTWSHQPHRQWQS
jgi:WD40 repeat protein